VCGLALRCAISRLVKNDSHHLRCWKDGKPYDERVYLDSLRRRGALLGAGLKAATRPEWKTVGGFQKLSENNA
jgi:hypothetical protein